LIVANALKQAGATTVRSSTLFDRAIKTTIALLPPGKVLFKLDALV